MKIITPADLKAFQEAIYKDYSIKIEDKKLYESAFSLLQFIEALIKFDKENKKN
ncbi:MAG TPA: hypothetical protein VFA93_02885 [Patescibacteria group bacterium]|nr:hypothetical protein [Patescibacteria group bacterium]